jgi:hypothetical protein
MRSLDFSPLPLGEGLGVRACSTSSHGTPLIPLSHWERGLGVRVRSMSAIPNDKREQNMIEALRPHPNPLPVGEGTGDETPY